MRHSCKAFYSILFYSSIYSTSYAYQGQVQKTGRENLYSLVAWSYETPPASHQDGLRGLLHFCFCNWVNDLLPRRVWGQTLATALLSETSHANSCGVIIGTCCHILLLIEKRIYGWNKVLCTKMAYFILFYNAIKGC